MRWVRGAHPGFSVVGQAPLKRALLTFAILTLSAVAPLSAQGDQATDLLFFSADLMSERNYAGVGWLHAAYGLDLSGPVFSAELGRTQWNSADGQVAVGWRFVESRVWLTLLGGVEAVSQSAPSIKPVGSVDFWWEPSAGWMASAQVQAATDYVSWRVAVGLKAQEDWPWIGPEARSSASAPRLGAHATGLELPGGLEARVSAGISWRRDYVGPYGELSVWRRF
jgi:Cellulose biosynthesis protein BcsS